MNNKVKELLLERYEVISRSADDCRYILEDIEKLSEEELENKLYTRFDRINSEMQVLDGYLKAWFKKDKIVPIRVDTTKDDNVFTLDDIEEFKKGRMAVNCKTKDLSKKFLDGLHDLGFKWCDGDNLNHYDNEWNRYGKETCYSDEMLGIEYSPCSYYIENKYKIKEFKGW